MTREVTDQGAQLVISVVPHCLYINLDGSIVTGGILYRFDSYSLSRVYLYNVYFQFLHR